ncbi:MAG: EAL domain-containing protein [Saccharofermentans sp.]|nr:EAL domain-containing protein [Saccharofermentans sp.]
MIPDTLSYYENYTPTADVLVVAVCLVFIVLIRAAYISRTRSFIYLRHMIYFAVTASVANLCFHGVLPLAGNIPNILIFIPHIIFHTSLYSILFLQVHYLREIMRLNIKENRLFTVLSISGFSVLILLEVLQPMLGFGMYVGPDGSFQREMPFFIFGYVFFVLLMFTMLFIYREMIFRPILVGLISSVSISFLLMLIQEWMGESSYTVFTFLFPIYALLYLAHSNPYDLEIGAVDERAFTDLMYLSFEQDEELYLMSLYMHEYDGKGQHYPEEIQKMVKHFVYEFFKHPTLFLISGGHLVLVVRTSQEPDYIDGGQRMIDEFMKLYADYKIDYKIVFLKNDRRLKEDNDCINFIKYLHFDMAENSILKPGDKEVESYLRYKYIVSELADINGKHDLNEPRVLVYCQPVLNIKSGKYDTAEALMRLKLPDTGIVYPDEFIYIAERFKYIYTLTQIILNKTCLKIKELLDDGYYVQRISVNFSVYDIREPDFCETIENIIKDSGIPYEKVAIEITETQNERDFENIKKRINELKDSGVRFYLDDFGTGYSNFERIMELPFDIVKFDRSLVIASGTGNKYKSMVSNLAMMFDNGEYSVLYEGIENDEDEKRCIDMNAKYLQGFKYSKPIPIDQLSEYLDKGTND